MDIMVNALQAVRTVYLHSIEENDFCTRMTNLPCITAKLRTAHINITSKDIIWMVFIADGFPDEKQHFQIPKLLELKHCDIANIVGTRKQNVKDAERHLSHSVAKFFEKEGHSAEAEYVKNLAD